MVHVRLRSLYGERSTHTYPKTHGSSVLSELESNEAIDNKTPKERDDQPDVDCCEPLFSGDERTKAGDSAMSVDVSLSERHMLLEWCCSCLIDTHRIDRISGGDDGRIQE